MDELDLRIRNHLYGSFVRSATVQPPAEIAAELGIGADEVAASLVRLHDAHAIVLDGGGDVRMLNPFSAVETPHRVEAAGRSWFANCAWDALGIPAALQADGAIESACADCGEPVALEVRGGALVRGRELLVHFLVPAARWWEDIAFT
jgi:hypothetical protein